MGRKAKVTKMGWGEGTIDQRGTRFRLRWREEDGRHALSFGSRQEALDELERIKARIALGQPGRAERPATIKPVSAKAIEDLVEEWLEYRERFGAANVGEDRARWNLHLAAPLSTTTIEAVTPRWVSELAAELVKPTVGSKAPDGSPKAAISGPTAYRVLTLLSAFYTWAVREGHATANPAQVALTDKATKRLLAPKSTDHEAEAPLASWAEVDRLYKALGLTSVGVWYLLQARCGLRPGEATALYWEDVDLARKKITVKASVRAGKRGETKGRKAREVPMSPVVVRELAKWRKVAPDHALVCPPGRRVTKEGELAGWYGVHLGDKAIDEAMAAAYEKAKIAPRSNYDAGRVTFATLVGGSGEVSAFTLQRWMGHASVTTTERYVRARELGAGELKALG